MPGTQGPHDVFLRVRLRGDGIETEGPTDVLLGHRVPIAGRPPAGTWLIWSWDGQQLAVTRDRFGAYPLFYATTSDSIVISPSIDRILATGVSRSLDLDALSAFAAVGFYLEADTPFRDIRALAAGASLTWRPGRLEVHRPSEPLRAATDRAASGHGGHRRDGPGGGPPLRADGGRGAGTSCRSPAGAIRGSSCSSCAARVTSRDSAVTAGHYPHIGGGRIERGPGRSARPSGSRTARSEVDPSIVAAEMRKNRITGYCSDEHSWSLAVADAFARPDRPHVRRARGRLAHEATLG